MKIFFSEWLEKRLLNPLPGESAQRKMMNVNRPDILLPENARHSAVLILLFPENDEISIALIERVADGSIHSGQIALPGGRMEKEDADLITTALREANEEVGLQKNEVAILGELTRLYIPVSNFIVQPVVSFAKIKPGLFPSDSEVARILYIPLRALFARKEKVDVKASGTHELVMHVNAYILEEHTILWGATAMILSELETLWNEFNVFRKTIDF